MPARLWNVPHPRNQFFTGRGALLDAVHGALKVTSTATITQPQAISGLGGVGKTQAAVEYAYRYREEYTAVFWARAHSRNSLTNDFAEIARLLNLPQRDASDE